MKLIFTLTFLLFANNFLFAQKVIGKKNFSKKTSIHTKKTPINFNGQWKGGFSSSVFSGIIDDDIVYVLELKTEGSRITGYSYTYFNGGPKKYYTICRLTGSIDPRDKDSIEVTEVERIKYNTPPPPEFNNCFQTHRLHYEKDDNNTETLRGTWIPAPNQNGNCGNGVTILSRRIVDKMPLAIKTHKPAEIARTPQKKIVPKKEVAIAPQKKQASIAKKASPPIAKKEPPEKLKTEKSQTVISNTPIPDNQLSKLQTKKIVIPPIRGYENRKNTIIKTIAIEQPTFRLDFYDNGEIDGDSISVFYNGKVVLSHRMLTDKPITLTLSLDENVKENVVTMYAENLGTIPPNTALMIVTDGNKRYEVRMESDLGKSGTVVFVHGGKGN